MVLFSCQLDYFLLFLFHSPQMKFFPPLFFFLITVLKNWSEPKLIKLKNTEHFETKCWHIANINSGLYFQQGPTNPAQNRLCLGYFDLNSTVLEWSHIQTATFKFLSILWPFFHGYFSEPVLTFMCFSICCSNLIMKYTSHYNHIALSKIWRQHLFHLQRRHILNLQAKLYGRH